MDDSAAHIFIGKMCGHARNTIDFRVAARGSDRIFGFTPALCSGLGSHAATRRN